MIMIHVIQALLNDFNMIKLEGTIFLSDTHVNVKAPPDENLNTPFPTWLAFFLLIININVTSFKAHSQFFREKYSTISQDGLLLVL